MLKLTLSPAPTLTQEIRINCALCGQAVEDEETILTFDQQAVEIKLRSNYTNPCIKCCQDVSFFEEEEDYKEKVKAHLILLKKRLHEISNPEQWDPKIDIQVDRPWLGQCPMDNSEMYANIADNFECPICRLQILARGTPQSGTIKGVGLFRLDRDGLRISAVDVLSTRIIP
jgi:hypothetical protein